jgi:RNA polymerase sigma-70 factor (ECF subfamily)
MPDYLDNQTTRQLWQRMRAGDQAAFDQLARMHHRLLLNFGSQYSKDRELIKDCVQDLFLGIWERQSQLTEPQMVTAYLVNSLRNNLVRRVSRKQAAPLSGEEESLTDNACIESYLIETESEVLLSRHLRQALDQLPSRQREILFLKFYQNLDNEQIAECLLINKQTVANQVHSAIKTLRKHLPKIISGVWQWVVVWGAVAPDF